MVLRTNCTNNTQVSSHYSSLFFWRALTASSSNFIFLGWPYPPAGLFLLSHPPPDEKLGVGSPASKKPAFWETYLPPLCSEYISMLSLSMLIKLFLRILFQTCSENSYPWVMMIFSRVKMFALLISALLFVPRSCTFSNNIVHIL